MIKDQAEAEAEAEAEDLPAWKQTDDETGTGCENTGGGGGVLVLT